MKTEFETNRTSREVYARYFENYTLEQLNKVPQGFSNNLIWNIGHIIVSQQLLVYGGSGQAMHVSQDLINKYMRGTRPEGDVTQQEADEIKNLLFWPIDKAEEDYNAGLFTTYTERKTQMGFLLKTVNDAIAFNNYHEGIHLGIMMSIRKFL
ncbi:MAG TPA: DinB family protein [Flavobacterium sp.]|nr:DinB family protein [Flavobacterium sp.]